MISYFHVRPATAAEAAYIVALADRVQAWLVARGSLQQIGPLASDWAAAEVAAGNALLLFDERTPLGSVFVSPLTDDHLPGVPLTDLCPAPCFFLHKLMLEPQQQRRGLGNLLLDAAKAHAAAVGGSLVLDCWAGNDKLRSFYEAAGFCLLGIYPAEGGAFEVAVFSWG